MVAWSYIFVMSNYLVSNVFLLKIIWIILSSGFFRAYFVFEIKVFYLLKFF